MWEGVWRSLAIRWRLQSTMDLQGAFSVGDSSRPRTSKGVEKTEGLWLGSWKQRTDKPFNLDWKSSRVKCLGIWIGNEDTTNENFIEQQSKVKNKLKFWKELAYL